ncbi:MAG: hypothetical protein FWC82_02420, partial [Firmicutes bacterium]|nr:hypothetical protein [Bacillota bacterium]
HFLAKEPFDFEIMHKGYAIIDSALEFFSAPFSPSFLEKIAELSIKFSELTQKMGNSRLLCGGESQTAHAMNLLFLHEERALRLRGEVEMFVAPIVMNLYQSTLLQKRSFFVSPPDNNARLHYLCEFFGLKQQRIINKIRPILSNNEVDLMTYRLDEYREELSELAMKNSSRLQRGWKIFKRLYTDDGYALRKEIDSSDVSIALALAPDLKNKFTFLTALKCMGLLEGYIGE